MKYHLTVNETAYEVEIEQVEGDRLAVRVNNEPYRVTWQPPADTPAQAATPPPAGAGQRAAAAPAGAFSAPAAPRRATAGGGSVVAPIPGLILDIKVGVGEAIEAGQTVAVIEAMKMENNLSSTVSGTVREIRVAKGAQVATGDVIMVIG